MVATTQILKKLQLLQELIGEEDIGDEVTERHPLEAPKL